LFFMLLSLATGVIYFTFAVTGLSLSAGLAVLVIGIPFFLVFMALTRVVSLAEGRLIEAMTGERMPRRPIHQSGTSGFWSRVGQMLKDRRTWTTLAYLILMLPLGIAYFVIAVVGLSLSLAFTFTPLIYLSDHYGWFDPGNLHIGPAWLESLWALPFMMLTGILLLTLVMHVARGVGRLHAMYAKALLVAPAGV
jgi:Putative sensor